MSEFSFPSFEETGGTEITDTSETGNNPNQGNQHPFLGRGMGLNKEGITSMQENDGREGPLPPEVSSPSVPESRLQPTINGEQTEKQPENRADFGGTNDLSLTGSGMKAMMED